MLKYIQRDGYIIVILDSKSYTIHESDSRYKEIHRLSKYKYTDIKKLKKILDVETKINKSSNKSSSDLRISYENGTLYLNDKDLTKTAIDLELYNVLANILWSCQKDNNNSEMEMLYSFSRFVANLLQNPSKESQKELYGFLKHNDLPLTEDGCFLAYKRITRDWKDCYTKTIDNNIGAIVTMPRNLVNPDRNKTCSSGLHFCSKSYLDEFGGERLVIIKINPKNVVSIPSDYNDSKGRCCEYVVVEEVEDNNLNNLKEEYKKPVLLEKKKPVAKERKRKEYATVLNTLSPLGASFRTKDGCYAYLRKVIEEGKTIKFKMELRRKKKDNVGGSDYIGGIIFNSEGISKCGKYKLILE